MFSTIRGRIELLIFLVLIPTLAQVVFNAFATRRRERAEVQLQASQITRLVTATHERLAETTDHLFSALVRIPAIAGDHSAECQTALASILEGADRFQNLGVASREGRVTCSARPVPRAVPLGDSVWFRAASGRRTLIVGGYELSSLAPGPTVVFARGTASGNHIVFAALSLTWLSGVIGEASLPPISSVTVLEESGTVLARYPDHARWVGRDVSSSPIVATALAHNNGVTEAAGIDQVVRLYGYRRASMTAGSDFIVTVGIPLEVAYAATDRHLRVNLALLAATTVIILAAARYAMVLTRRIEGLLRAARRLSAGDLTARTEDTSTSDELGELARAFDTMAWALQGRTANMQQMTESLRGLAARLEAVREEERTRISREIHDELGQYLTGIRMDVDRLEEHVQRAELPDSDRRLIKAKIQSARALVDATLDTARRISRQLRPSVLDVLGLRAGIEWQLEEFQARTAVSTELLADENLANVDEQSSLALFRILQEALTNVARHAQATSVTVRLAREDRTLMMEVMDNGRGFAHDERPSPRSLGLLGMRERAATFGGETVVTSQPGRGTTVYVRLPLNSGSATS